MFIELAFRGIFVYVANCVKKIRAVTGIVFLKFKPQYVRT